MHRERVAKTTASDSGTMHSRYVDGMEPCMYRFLASTGILNPCENEVNDNLFGQVGK